MQLAIIDLGVGNLRSVEQAFKHVAPHFNVQITRRASEIDNADRVVLPGQGAIGSWFRELDQRGLRKVVMDALVEKPTLGICVGMQALFSHCEEDGDQSGLGLFQGSVRHFRHFHQTTQNGERLKIPQMGWNQVTQTSEHPMWHGIPQNSHFYFLHSYCANLDQSSQNDDVHGVADYGHQYIAAIGRGNLFATQFHPEKSHNDGLQLLRNFSQWND